jgi:hypothetical protein
MDLTKQQQMDTTWKTELKAEHIGDEELKRKKEELCYLGHCR